MIFTTRDLDILRFLRWCRFVLAEDLTGVFSKAEVQNLEILRLIKLYQPAQAYTLTAAGNRLLDAAFPKLPAAVAPAYKAADTLRRIRQAKLMTTAYQAGVSVFTTDVSALCEQAMFLPMIARNRGSNPWGSTRVAALLHTGDLMCAIHWVSPGIGCVALTDELTAFQNHTASIPAKQRAMIFAASSYEEILAELDAGQKDQNTRLQSYREVYRFLSSLFFSLALPQLSNFARLQCAGGRLPVLTNFCLDEYCNIGYLDGVADSLNSIRGFNMSAQIVVQSLSQWQEKYPGKEWENQLATFDQTLYMGCNDLTSAKYISEKCGKVTISVLNNQMPMMPLFSPVYSSTRPYSQTRSNTQRDLMNPDEVLRLENRKCLALFKGHKPALLYKMTPEELPDYAGLTTCRVIDYIPEWRRKESEAAPQKRPQAPAQKEPSSIPKTPGKEKQPDRSEQPPAYDLAEDDEIGMVECTVDSILNQ